MRVTLRVVSIWAMMLLTVELCDFPISMWTFGLTLVVSVVVSVVWLGKVAVFVLKVLIVVLVRSLAVNSCLMLWMCVQVLILVRSVCLAGLSLCTLFSIS